MTQTTLTIRDGSSTPVTKYLAVEDNGSLGITPYHLEDSTQRAALMSLLGTHSTVAKQDLGNASLATIATALSSPLPVSISSLPLSIGASTSALQTIGNQSLASIASSLGNPLVVSGPLTATQLSTAGLASSGQLPSGLGAKSSTNSLSVTLSSDSNHATSTKQDIGNSSLASIATTLTGTLSVSVSSTVLASNAATASLQTTGNQSLASIATSLSGPLTVTGPLTSTQLAAAGLAASIQLPSTIGSKSSANSLAVVLASDGNHATSLKQDTANTSLAAIQSTLAGTLAVGATALPLPSGAATDATLQSILTKLSAARAETLWTDDSNAYFVRIDNAGSISWMDILGNTSSGPGTGARPASGASVLLIRGSYQATAAGTGYSSGDYLDHVVTVDPNSGTIVGHFWINISTEIKLTNAPSASSIAPISPLPAGAATDSSIQAIKTTLGSPLQAGGTVSVSNFPSTQVVSGTVTANLGTVNGLALDTSVQAVSGKLPASLGSKTSATSLSIAPASDAIFSVTGPLTQAQLTSAALATSAKQDAMVAALAAILKSNLVDSAGASRQNAGINVSSSSPNVALSAASTDGVTNASTGISGIAVGVRGDFNVTTYSSDNFTGAFVIERRFTTAGGTNWHPLTAAGTVVSFPGPMSETFSEPQNGVDYRIRITSYSSGTLTYRISQ